MAYNGSQSIGTFYGYADGSRYGKYTPCILTWSDVTRSGDTVTVKDLTLTMTHEGSGWTTYRFACKGSITGTTTTTYANNYTLKAYEPSKESNPATIKVNFGNISVKTLQTTVSCYIELASTKGSTSWTNFASTNTKKTFNISCPPANPTYKTQPSITNIEETSFVLNSGTTDIDSKFYYQEDGTNEWILFSGTTAKISNKKPNQSYKYNFKAINSLSSDYVTNGNSVSVKTYNYPYITNISASNMIADLTTQTVTIYNPLKRKVRIVAKDALAGEDSTLYEKKDFTGTQDMFTLKTIDVSEAIPSDGFVGQMQYYCQYGSQAILATKSGTIEIKPENCKPAWKENSTIETIFTYKDGDPNIVAMTKKDEDDTEVTLIQRFSKLYYGVNFIDAPAISNYNAEIKKYYISIDGTEFQEVETSLATPEKRAQIKIDGTLSDHQIDAHTNAISIRIKAIDSRGLETPFLQKSIPVYQYNEPSGAIAAYRKGGYGDTIVLQVSPVWGVNQTKNAGKISYTYKEGGNEAIPEQEIEEKVVTTKSLELDNLSNDSIFTFYVKFQDSLGVITQLDPIVVGLGKPILFIDSEQNGVGINCFPEGQGLFVDGKATLNGETKVKGSIEIDGNLILKNGFSLIGTHRNQIYEKNGGTEKRTGWFFDEGGNQ